MVAGGNRLSPTESADETGMAEQGAAIKSIKLFWFLHYEKIILKTSVFDAIKTNLIMIRNNI